MSITASDIDASASLSYRVGVDASGNDVTNVDSSYGTFSVDGSGTWTYDIDNSAADSLDNGDSVTESFTVTVADGLGGTDTQEVVVTITGTNDSSNVLSISPDYAVVTPRTGADDTGVLLNYQAGTGTASDPVRFESFTTDAPPDVYWISSDGAAIGKVSWAFNSDGNQITGTVGSRTVMTLTLTDSDTKYSVDVVDAGVFYGNAPDIKSATANAPLISAGGPAPQIADIGNGAGLTVTGIGGNGGNANKINGSSDQFGVGDANFDPTDKVIFTLNNSPDSTTTLASLTLASSDSIKIDVRVIYSNSTQTEIDDGGQLVGDDIDLTGAGLNLASLVDPTRQVVSITVTNDGDAKSKLSLIDVGTVSSPATDLILNFGVNASDAVSTVTGTIAVGLDQDSTPDVIFDGLNKATVIDGVVVGMSYSTSSGIAGATDFNGTFKYGLGDTVTFSIGSVVVGTISAASALADGKLFLQEIAGVGLRKHHR